MNNLHVKSMWILLIGSGVNSFAVFLSIPVITVHAYNLFDLSLYQIGWISGIWPTTVFFCSSICGILADRYGYLLAIRSSAIINGLAFLILAIAKNLDIFILGLFLFGVGKSFFDSTIRASIACLCEPDEREKYFRIRYVFLNLGAVLGPIIGIYAYKIIPNGAFFLTSIVYLLLFITTIIYIKTRVFKAESERNFFNFLSTIVVLKDFKLLCWVISGALVLMAYGLWLIEVMKHLCLLLFSNLLEHGLTLGYYFRLMLLPLLYSK